MSDSPEEVAAAALLKHEPPYPDVNGVYDCCASEVVAALREAGYLVDQVGETLADVYDRGYGDGSNLPWDHWPESYSNPYYHHSEASGFAGFEGGTAEKNGIGQQIISPCGFGAPAQTHYRRVGPWVAVDSGEQE